MCCILVAKYIYQSRLYLSLHRMLFNDRMFYEMLFCLGEMRGTLHRKVLEEHQLEPGCGLFLKQVG